MLNVVTVHWQSTRWIEPQLRYLEQNVGAPFRVFASLNGIADPAIRDRFHLAEDVAGTHAEKLNELARVVHGEAEPDDTLLFLDGDAFPIRPMDGWMHEVMGAFPLAAVRREENLGDCQPHPCFCLTTVGFWHAIGGDWREGGTWTNSIGETTTDVGGNLLHLLADQSIDWLPLLRTNTHNPNPIWFGIYDHRVYHHGAGFRPRISRVGHHLEASRADREGSSLRGSSLEGLARRAVRDPSLIREGATEARGHVATSGGDHESQAGPRAPRATTETTGEAGRAL